MKKYIILIMSVLLSGVLAACGTAAEDNQYNQENAVSAAEPAEGADEAETEEVQTVNPQPKEPAEEDGKILVAYFSNTGNTQAIAEMIAEHTGADLFEIKAAIPYTEDDLDYNNSDSRTSGEQNDDTARPEIANMLENAGDYDAVFLGYPIWWGQAPKILYTFIEEYDFSEAVVVPFCTSGSSGIGSSAENLQAADEADTQWLEGERFGQNASADEVQLWVKGLGLGLE